MLLRMQREDAPCYLSHLSAVRLLVKITALAAFTRQRLGCLHLRPPFPHSLHPRRPYPKPLQNYQIGLKPILKTITLKS